MAIIDYFHDQIPILGICLGHQGLGQYFGACLEHAEKPMHGKISTINFRMDPIFREIDEPFEVVRYHSLVLTKLPKELDVIATAGNGEVMTMVHNSLPLYGIQFHPEAALSKHGLKILHNWATFNQIIA